MTADESFQKSLAGDTNWLEQTLDTIGEPAVATNSNGVIIYVNSLAEQLFGCEISEMTGKNFHDVLAVHEPDANNRVSDLLSIALREGLSLTGMERVLVSTHLGKRYMECSATPLIETSGGLQGAIFILKDVTARRRAEEELQRSETMYRQLFRDSHETIFRICPNGMLMDINPAGRKLLGIASGELAADITLGSWFEDPKSWNYMLERLRSKAIVKDFEISLRSVSKSLHRLIVNIHADKDVDGNLIAFNGIMHDVTARRKRQQKVMQDSKMESISRLAGGIAHDFNNLLTGIVGYSSMTKEAVEPSSSAYQYMTAVEKATRRGIDLTSRLLGLARVGNRDMRELKVNRFLQNVINTMEQSVPESVTIALEEMDFSPVIEADPLQLEQGISHLIRNAIEAMEGLTGKITIRCKRLQEKVVEPAFSRLQEPLGIVMEIVDEGCGIPANQIDKIYEPFYTTRRSPGNIGLGLSLTYGIICNHRGHLQVESTVGRGSTFRIYLPCAQLDGVDVKVHKAAPDKDKVTAGTVLLIEDEETIRDLARDLLVRRGYELLLAEDGLSGLEIFRQHGERIDLVILDLLMPGPDGTEIFSQLQHIRPNVPVIIATGMREVQEVGQLLDNGAAGVILKPFSIHDFLKKIERVMVKQPAK